MPHRSAGSLRRRLSPALSILLLWALGAVCWCAPGRGLPPPCEVNVEAFGWGGKLSDKIRTKAFPEEIRLTGEDPVHYSNYFSFAGQSKMEEGVFRGVPVPPQRSFYYRVDLRWRALYWHHRYDPDHDHDLGPSFAEHAFSTHYELHLGAAESGHAVSFQFYLHSWDIPKYY